MTAYRVPFREATRTSIASWTVRLDGQMIPAAIGGTWILDAIPVAMTQIDSIVVMTGPRIVDGRATFLGSIELFTRRPIHGVSAIADYQHGDETGDPGPYRYTTRRNQNVEKLGPFTSGAAALAKSTWSIDVAARYASLNITDTNIVRQF